MLDVHQYIECQAANKCRIYVLDKPEYQFYSVHLLFTIEILTFKMSARLIL